MESHREALEALASLPVEGGIPVSAHALEHVPLPISIVKAVRLDGEIVDFCIEYTNQAAASLVDTEDRTSPYGRPFREVLPEFEQVGLLDRFLQVATSGEPYVAEALEFAGALDGVQFDLVLDIVVVPLGEDRLMSVSHDRTREHRLGAELTAAQGQIERRRAVEQQVRLVNDGLLARLVDIQRALDAGDVAEARRHAQSGSELAADVVVGLRNMLRLRPT